MRACMHECLFCIMIIFAFQALNADMFCLLFSRFPPSVEIWLALDWNPTHLLSDFDIEPQVQKCEMREEES